MQTPVKPSPTLREVQAITAARLILEKHQLAHLPLPEALAHLRAKYALQRHGLKDYVLDSLGKLAHQPTRLFMLCVDVGGRQACAIPDEALNVALVDYLLTHYDHHTLPTRIEVLAPETEVPQIFFV